MNSEKQKALVFERPQQPRDLFFTKLRALTDDFITEKERSISVSESAASFNNLADSLCLPENTEPLSDDQKKVLEKILKKPR